MKKALKIIGLAALAALIAGGGFAISQFSEKSEANTNGSGQIAGLQKRIDELEQKLKDNQETTLPTREIVRREIVKEKSQDELLTEAVARVTPAVVSVVVSKDVPLLEVIYQNPFGDDPFFKDFDFRIPVYRQRGVEHKQVGAGTGFLITSDGFILTNKHVVADQQADYTALLADGTQKPARVAYLDPAHDVAIIKIEGKFPTVSFGDSSKLQLGQTVIAIGNALGEYNNSVSVGIVSGLNRNISAAGSAGNEVLTNVIQTDAAINPGNSGGPLVDLNGKVIGVNVATVIGSNNISFSIPIDTVKTILKSVLGI